MYEEEDVERKPLDEQALEHSDKGAKETIKVLLDRRPMQLTGKILSFNYKQRSCN